MTLNAPCANIVVVDNDDSFTGSLVDAFRTFGARVAWENWATVAGWTAVDLLHPGLIVLSPGPGRPEERPVNAEICRVRGPAGRPVFGVCLGMQAMVLTAGGRVVPAREPVHGRADLIYHARRGCFGAAPTPFRATRYHSLAAERASLPACLEVTAWTEDGTLMGLRHRTEPLEGVQFHPESVGTRHGVALLHAATERVLGRAADPARGTSGAQA